MSGYYFLFTGFRGLLSHSMEFYGDAFELDDIFRLGDLYLAQRSRVDVHKESIYNVVNV